MLKLSIQELRDEKEKATKKEDYAQAAVIKKALFPLLVFGFDKESTDLFSI
jgi:hypothetical protein